MIEKEATYNTKTKKTKHNFSRSFFEMVLKKSWSVVLEIYANKDIIRVFIVSKRAIIKPKKSIDFSLITLELLKNKKI